MCWLVVCVYCVTSQSYTEQISDTIVFQAFQIITPKSKFRWVFKGGSLIVELGQFVTRYNHMLHPRFRDRHQVSHASADVVSAHGQSESCTGTKGWSKGGGGRGGKKTDRNRKKQVKYRSGWTSTNMQYVTFIQLLNTTTESPTNT